MILKDLKLRVVNVPKPGVMDKSPEKPDPDQGVKTQLVLVTAISDTGIEGYGFGWGTKGGMRLAHTIAEVYRPEVIGEDVEFREKLWQKAHKADTQYQVWQEGMHPKLIESEKMMMRPLGFTTATLLSLFLLAGATVTAQPSTLDASEARAFIGAWVISMESPRGGTRDQNVTIRDEDGKLAARIEGGRGGGIDVTDITTNGDRLVLSFERNGRRGTIDIVMTLTLDGDMIRATQEFAGGQFSVSGTGKKQ